MLKHHDQEQNLSDNNHGVLPAPALHGAAVYQELTSTGTKGTHYLPLPGGGGIDLDLIGTPRWFRHLRRQVARLRAKCQGKGPYLTLARGKSGQVKPGNHGGMKNHAKQRCRFFTGPGQKDTLERTAGMMPA